MSRDLNQSHLERHPAVVVLRGEVQQIQWNRDGPANLTQTASQTTSYTLFNVRTVNMPCVTILAMRGSVAVAGRNESENTKRDATYLTKQRAATLTTAQPMMALFVAGLLLKNSAANTHHKGFVEFLNVHVTQAPVCAR